MAEQGKSGIAWTEQTWNPIRGCRRKNKDCIHCYAERVAARFSGPGKPYEGLVDDQGRWNGTIRFIEDHLLDPLRWERPRLIFVNSMSDLFFEEFKRLDGVSNHGDAASYRVLPDSTIDQIVAVMWLSWWHTHQVLTKRPGRMLEYLTDPATPTRVYAAAMTILGQLPKSKRHALVADLRVPPMDSRAPWPLPNVWWGASMGHQAAVDEFGPSLLRLRDHAAVLWVSVEPQIERLSLHRVLPFEGEGAVSRVVSRGIDWAVVGGESGAKARPFDLAWARELREECRRAGVAFFLKQLGRYPGYVGTHNMAAGQWVALTLKDSTHGADPSEWPADVRVREYPAAIADLKRRLGVTGMSLS